MYTDKDLKTMWYGYSLPAIILTIVIGIILFICCPEVHAAKVPEFTSENAIRTIMGEEENNTEAMLFIASTLRNRNTLRGAYGHRAITKIGNTYYRISKKGKRPLPQSTYDNAKRAWELSKNINKGCYHWFSKQDLKQAEVQRIIRKDKLVLVASFGKGLYINYFYKRG